MGYTEDKDLIELLTTYLKLDEHDIYEYSIPINLGRLWDIVTEESLAHLTLPTYTPKTLPPLEESSNIFEVIEREGYFTISPF